MNTLKLIIKSQQKNQPQKGFAFKPCSFLFLSTSDEDQSGSLNNWENCRFSCLIESKWSDDISKLYNYVT